MNEPSRKNIRLREWDYGSDSFYHVTICTRDRKPLFGVVRNPDSSLASPFVELSDIGECCAQVLHDIDLSSSCAHLFNYVVMPNHVHMLVWINPDGSRAVTLQSFVRFFKSSVTKRAKKAGFCGDLWQKSYYETIIRDDAAFDAVWEYIENNPAKWLDDEYCCERGSALRARSGQ